MWLPISISFILNVLLFTPNTQVSAGIVPVRLRQGYSQDSLIDYNQDPKTGNCRAIVLQDGLEKREICGYENTLPHQKFYYRCLGPLCLDL